MALCQPLGGGECCDVQGAGVVDGHGVAERSVDGDPEQAALRAGEPADRHDEPRRGGLGHTLQRVAPPVSLGVGVGRDELDHAVGGEGLVRGRSALKVHRGSGEQIVGVLELV